MYPFDPYVIQKIYKQLQFIQRNLENLNERLTDLEVELNDIRNEKQMYIDRIEYKFDQLKVERLEGTLNIGLTPQDREAIEQYVVGGNEDKDVNEVNQELFSRVQQQIFAYLQDDVFENVKEVEEKYNYRLDDPYRRFIIEDIKRQIDKRITMYINNLERKDPKHPEKEKVVIEKVRNDIHKAIEEFIKHLPKQEG
ncbi:spore germination protein GerPC [Pueribacillus sp. YX66]|uniref:spore germination protein GerPC n=1 Tax=Pueribacillus sp. YX66 TaxID=3229242 RepID=UPI00358D043F